MKDKLLSTNNIALFDSAFKSKKRYSSEEVFKEASKELNKNNILPTYTPNVSERLLDIYARAKNPSDPFELRDIYLGRVEYELGAKRKRQDLAELWKSSKKRREFSSEEILNSNTTIRFVKELFNFYFRDDLYGKLESDNNIILSSGAVYEEVWGLPDMLKECLLFALEKDWYGYSDSRGRNSPRIAIAAYENEKMNGFNYDLENVVITMGATYAISSLSDFILRDKIITSSNSVLCGTPNYPPLVESIALRHPVKLVPLTTYDQRTSLKPIIDALRPETPMVMVQTVLNPNGTIINENEIKELILKASPSTMIILDECHEWLGPKVSICKERSASNVIRVSSLSKEWSAPGLKIGWFMADSRFVSEYYEYASTTYGGPPSFYYTLIEFLAIMETWICKGIEMPEQNDLITIDSEYSLNLEGIQKTYIKYKKDRERRAKELIASRNATINRMSYSNTKILLPEYSINLGIEIPKYNDSYLCFRNMLEDISVSLYPGILNFGFSNSFSRITFARPWRELEEATERINNYLS